MFGKGVVEVGEEVRLRRSPDGWIAVVADPRKGPAVIIGHMAETHDTFDAAVASIKQRYVLD